MAKKLLIVESPAKAKTIEKYLGEDFSVKSSYGHIRDLEKGNDLGVDVEHDYRPNYVIPPDKHKTVKELKESAGKSAEVWLATDEDREGEAISWHLCEVLGLDVKVTKRIVFHEITKPAIQKAVQSPRLLNMNVVNAQQARRVLDRLVGWELSGLLWKKVRGQLSIPAYCPTCFERVKALLRKVKSRIKECFARMKFLQNMMRTICLLRLRKL